MDVMHRGTQVMLFLMIIIFGTCGPVRASLMRSVISGRINTIWSDPSAGLDIGDTVSAEFVYNDGDISHAPWVAGSMEPMRRYQSRAQVTFDPGLIEWMHRQNVSSTSPETGIYELVEPDGTELDEMFSVDNSFFFLNIILDIYSLPMPVGSMYFSFNGQRGGFEAYGLSVVTTPLQAVPEPSTLLLFGLALPCFFLAGNNRYSRTAQFSRMKV